MRRGPLLALTLILLLGLALRLYHVHSPILDHPAWRQGDEAAIARNFFELRNNIFYPQTDYDGPPPNYVELELQIVPFAAAQLYRVFGVHEILRAPDRRRVQHCDHPPNLCARLPALHQTRRV